MARERARVDRISCAGELGIGFLACPLGRKTFLFKVFFENAVKEWVPF